MENELERNILICRLNQTYFLNEAVLPMHQNENNNNHRRSIFISEKANIKVYFFFSRCKRWKWRFELPECMVIRLVESFTDAFRFILFMLHRQIESDKNYRFNPRSLIGKIKMRHKIHIDFTSTQRYD